jgi:proton glutamate symport protein
VLGLAAGIAVSSSGSPALMSAAAAIEPLGTLWINAIRMTVIPLVVSSLIVGVTSAPDMRTIGRIGGRALVLFLLVLFAAGAFAALTAPALFARMPIDAGAAAALQGSAAGTSDVIAEGLKKTPTASQWLVDLVPSNPVKAAADGAMLPLIVFSLAFGLALTRVGAHENDAGGRRAALVRVFQAISETSLVLVRWILVLAPIGVFALAVPLAARLGLGAAGALASYVVIVSLLVVLFSLLVLYPAAVLFGRVSPATFARAALPAQAVAFSARSSLAALPAMIESATTRLRLAPEITSFLLPLAAATFRAGAAIGQTVGVLFIAHLYGIEVTAAQLATVVVTVVLTSFSIPGIPAGSIIVMVPVLLAAGLPAAGIGILIGIDTIPDMFRTTCNVTADMAVATVLGRSTRGAQVVPEVGERPGLRSA